MINLIFKILFKITYAQAYFDAFLLPVNNGDSSARNRISVFTLSASPEKEKKINISFNKFVKVKLGQ
jgi:hypothetical protein